MIGRCQYFAIHSFHSNPQMIDINVQNFVVFGLELFSKCDSLAENNIILLKEEYNITLICSEMSLFNLITD